MTEFEIVGSNGRRFLRIYDEEEEIHIMIAIDDEEIEELYDQADTWIQTDDSDTDKSNEEESDS